MTKFWKLKNSVEGSGTTLYIDGAISSEQWWGDEATPQQLRDELKGITSNEITVVINSGGGDVWAGVAMYNALRELDAKVTVRVDGLAASIASVIAMAGDRIIMSPGSMMMVHKASAWAGGNTEELAKIIEMLEVVEKSIVPIYADRTGLSEEKVMELMEAETWMSPAEAVEFGFADEVAKKSIDEAAANSFSGNLAFSMAATKESIEAAQARMDAEDTPDPVPPEVTEPPVETEVEEDDDSTNTTPPTDEVTNEAKSTEPANEKGAEAEKEKPVTPKVEDKTTMSKTDAIATDAVITPAEQAAPTPVVDMKTKVKDYLHGKTSMDAFARILEEQAGKTSDDVKNAWKEHLEVTLGVTNPEILLPEALITEIEDAFKAGGEIWNRVTKTGVDVFKAAWDTEDDVDSEDGRARGYNRDEQEEKAEQVLTIAARVLRPQFVYKYITLNKEDVKNQRSTGALVRYVLSELPRRIVREVERAIVIGDGRAPSSDYKIDSFVSVKADATANNAFATTYTPVADEDHYATLVQAADLLEVEGRPTLIAKKGYITSMKLAQNANGGYIFPLGTNFQDVLGLDAIVEPDWMESDADNDAYLVVLPSYKTVGDNTIEAFTNFILKTNKQEYLQELWAGGGLTMRKAAVAIAADASS